MKTFSLFLISVLMLQSFAWAAGPTENLKNIVDEHRYALTVEWDQKDKAELERINANFSAEIKNLVNQGLTAEHVQSFIKENAKDLNLDNVAIAAMTDGQGKIDLFKAQEILTERSNALYMQGSSWIALEDLALWGFVGLFISFVLVMTITYPGDCPHVGSYPNNVEYECTFEDEI